MKTTSKIIKSMIIGTCIFLFFACSKEDDTVVSNNEEIQQEDGITAEELDSYRGDLGLIINTRELLKLGYEPISVSLSTNATEGDYDQIIEIDEFTSIALFKLSTDDLNDAAIEELQNGVAIELEIFDASNSIITTYSSSIVSFEEGGTLINIVDNGLEYLNKPINLNQNLAHYMQLVDANGNYGNDIVWKPSSAQDQSARLIQKTTSSFNQGTTSEQFYFYKFPNSDNEYAIYSVNTNRYLTIGQTTRTFRQSGAFSYPQVMPETLGNDYRFIIKRESNGLYTISGATDGNPLRRFNHNGDINWHTNSSGSLQYFRIISLDLDWVPTILNTVQNDPILPASNTRFGFNSTLINCGSGPLDQTVGITQELTTTYTNSFSETIGFSSRVTTSLDVSVSATAEASFFGNGATVTGEVSAGLELSVEANNSSTVGTEQSESETENLFSSRVVNVPAYSASLVYDSYQTYSNVRIPYVQRIRLKGNHTESSEQLSGEEIQTQLLMTNFTGTILIIGSDYVEVAIRGNMYLDNIVRTQTEIRDVAANCD